MKLGFEFQQPGSRVHGFDTSVLQYPKDSERTDTQHRNSKPAEGGNSNTK